MTLERLCVGPVLGHHARVAVCCSVLQCDAVCCSVLQCGAVWCSVLQCVAVCCSVLQCDAVCCSVVQCVALCCRADVSQFCCRCVAGEAPSHQDWTLLPYEMTGSTLCWLSSGKPFVCCSCWDASYKLQRVAVYCSVLKACCSVLQCVAVCCSVLQCVAVCCSVLQRVAACCSVLKACCYVVLCVAVYGKFVAAWGL